MMRPSDLKSKIFLDSGDTAETKEIINLLGFLDGQTTNPTLIAKNPGAQKSDPFSFYKGVVGEVSSLIPEGSVSVEVYADVNTGSDEMFNQGKDMFTWIPNAHIKYPTTKAGLEAAKRSIQAGMRVNMTLCFSQGQAAAVYAATRGAKKGEVFVSPFVGRLDDRGENGMDLIENILKMYQSGDGHVEVLTASVRNMDHFMYGLALGSDIITSPFKLLKQWADEGMKIPGPVFLYNSGSLKEIPYEEISLDKDFPEYNISHPLTNSGIERFASDWNNLIK